MSTYSESYRQWTASLTAAERAELRRLGIDKPLQDSHSTNTDHDPADDAVAPAPAPAGKPPKDESTERVHDVLRRLVGELIGQDNSRLSLECLALVTGLSYSGCSMTEISIRHKITRAAVSKRCVELSAALNLKPSRAMRSLKARSRYRDARLKHLQNHTT